MFFNDFVTQQEADRALSSDGHGFAIGGRDEGVGHRRVGDEIGKGWRHGIGGPGVDTDAGIRGERGGSRIGRPEKAERERLDGVTVGVRGEA